MTVDEILHAFRTCRDVFPQQAFDEAVAQREAITPALLDLVEKAAADPVAAAKSADDLVIVFALYLLAEFRDTRAYRPCVAIAAAPEDASYQILGDVITDSLHRILASLFDGDVAPILELASDSKADEYARGSAVRSLVVLVRNDRITREEAVRCLRELFSGRVERSMGWVWEDLVTSVLDLPAPELRAEATQALIDKLGVEMYPDLDAVGRDMRAYPDPTKFSLITRAADEFGWWSNFSPDQYANALLARAGLEIPVREPQPAYEAPARPPAPPTHVPVPRPGPNERCPCGSGKKYKKCCDA